MHRLPRVLLMICMLAPRPATAESAGVWLDVPFRKQAEDGCGSAALAMLLGYWNAQGTAIPSGRADARAIQQQLYSRQAHGIFAVDLERYLRESGFRVFALRGTWGDLREHLAAGRPILVSIQPRAKKASLHYVVVAGMDWRREAVFIHDPARGPLLRIERPEFEKEWLAARNWMLLAVPGGPAA
jgi:predicted double-glycine peptidase